MKEIKLNNGAYIEVRADGDGTVVRIAVPDHTPPPQLPPADVPRYRPNRLATDEDIERILNDGEKPKTKRPPKCRCAACRFRDFEKKVDDFFFLFAATFLVLVLIYYLGASLLR